MILEQPTNTSPTGAKCQHNLTLIGDLAAELKVHKVFLTRNKPSPHHPPHFPLHHPTHTHSLTHTNTHTHTEALIFFESLFKIWGWILFSIYFTRVSTLSGMSGILEILAKSEENVRKILHISYFSGKFWGNVSNFWFCLVVSTFKSYVDINLVCIWLLNSILW